MPCMRQGYDASVKKSNYLLLGLLAGGLGIGVLLSKRRSSPQGSSTRVVYAVEEDKETISSTFARAPFFKVVEDGEVVDIVENPHKDSVPAGPPAAELVASLGASRVVAGSFGRVAEGELRSRGIETGTM